MAVARVRRTMLIGRLDRRTLLGVGLAALAALMVMFLTRPTPLVQVLVARADIPAGLPLGEADLTTQSVPSAAGLVEGVSIGELGTWTLAAPIRAGEPLLPSLLRSPALVDAGDLMAISAENDHAVLGRVSAGDFVDLYVTWPGGVESTATTELLAADVFVVEVGAANGGALSDSTVQLVIGVNKELALKLVRASRLGQLDIVRVGP